MTATGVKPMAEPEVLSGDSDAYLPVRVRLHRTIGHRAVPAARLQALMPDAFQRDVPIPGVRWCDVEYQGLVGVEPEGPHHVQVVWRGVGRAQVRGLCRQQG